jgi:hypothetical protein
MTTLKKLKQAIRARARKTGERYTAARRQVLLSHRKRSSPSAKPVAKASAAAPRETARPKAPAVRGAISDAAVLKKTGHGLDHWFAVLERFGAAHKGHTGAAEHLYEVHGVPGWHAQGITVAYERARGLRAANQSCTGKFQVSASKVLPVTVSEVADAINNPRRRSQWLAAADTDLARALNSAFTGAKPRSVAIKTSEYARMRYAWDGGTVEIRITGKPKGGGTSVVADNKDLARAELVEIRRGQWRAALESLRTYLSR